MALTLVDDNWCRGDYYELLASSFLNGRSSEVLCHNRVTSLFIIRVLMGG